MRSLALGVLLVFLVGPASKADQLQVELSPLASEPPGAVAVWELCFKSDVQLNRITVGVVEPTDYTSTYSGTMEWEDCPGGGATCAGTDTIFDLNYTTVDDGDTFAEQVGATLFLVIGGNPASGDLEGALAYPPNWSTGLQCVARLLLSPGVPMTNPPALLSLSAADTASIDWTTLDPRLCDEPVVVDGSRTACDTGSGSGLTNFTDSVVVASSHPEDYDGDLVRDEDDNCVYAMNADQSDLGGLKTSLQDNVGDACQCGEGEGTGTIEVGDDDLKNMADHLRGEVVLGFDESRCSLASPSSCTIHDAALLDSALQSSATLQNVCTAYTP